MGILQSGAALAATLDLDSSLIKALDNSENLKIAKVDVEISKTDVTVARSAYYPVIRGRINFERLKDMQKGEFLPITSVGDTVVPSGSRYQETIGLSLNHTLTDFGVRRRKLQIAHKDVDVKQKVYEQELRDFKIKVIDAYTQTYLSFKSLEASKSILDLAREIYDMKMRLYQAGVISRVDLAEESIQVAQSLDSIENYKHKLEENLQDLSSYTREDYDLSDLDMMPLGDEPESAPNIDFRLEDTAEAKMYNLQIEQKQKEIELLRRQYLPQVSIYSNYYAYGFDVDDIHAALKNMRQRTVSLGLSVNLPIFDGFKTQASIRKAELEKTKLALQKADKLHELEHQAKDYENQMDSFKVILDTKARILDKTQDKMTMLNRLSEQKVIEQTEARKEHIERIKSQLDFLTAMTQHNAAIKKYRILSEG